MECFTIGASDAGRSGFLDTLRLVGRRDADHMVGVPVMSEGTRDQLYLALRLAYLEEYADRTEPIPFIGDDLVTSLDEERTTPGSESPRGNRRSYSADLIYPSLARKEERSGTASSSLACSRVSQFRGRGPLLADVGEVGQARGLLLSDHAGGPGLTHQLGLLALAAFGRLARTNKTGV
jgi:hypothetical protein